MRKADRATDKNWHPTHCGWMVAISLVVMSGLSLPLSAQNFFQRVDSTLTANYRKGNIDTNYIARPMTKWTLKARFNLSGATIESEGVESGKHFKSELNADYKSTLSLGISYLGWRIRTFFGVRL